MVPLSRALALIQGHLDCLRELEGQEEAIRAMAVALREAMRAFTAGNGGSAATAIHLAHDLRSAGVRAHALTDSMAAVTAIANDLAYSEVFAQQLRDFDIGPGDAVVLVSASGNSKNVLRAAALARGRGATVIGLVGFGGGRLAGMADLKVVLQSRDYGEVEGVHSCLCHIIPGLIRAE